MTPEQYIKALHTLGLTPETAAPWLGVGRSTAYRYAQTGPIEPVARMLEMAVRVRGLERWDTFVVDDQKPVSAKDKYGRFVDYEDLVFAIGKPK